MRTREITLDQSFVKEVQELNAKRNIPCVVLNLAKALDALPANMAEDEIFHSLVTSSLGGRQLDQEELVLSLLELWRIRAGKDDEFHATPTAKWCYLHNTPEYQAVANVVKCPLEMGMVLHTISGYLNTYRTALIDQRVRKVEKLRTKVEQLVKTKSQNSGKTIKEVEKMFFAELINICSCYVDCDDYIQSFTWECEKTGEFEIAFANLFIRMANDPLTYV